MTALTQRVPTSPPTHSHPRSPSVSVQAKMSQQHPGIHLSRNTMCSVIPMLDLGTENTLVCPGDAAAGAAPDSITLKRWCCREPLQHLRSGCASQQHWGSAAGGLSASKGSPRSCQGGRAPGANISTPWLGRVSPASAGARGSAPLAAAAPHCACRAGGKHLKLLPAQIHHLTGKLTTHRDCKVITRSFVHPMCICCTPPSCRQGSSTQHCPTTRDSPWPGQQLIRRVPCRVIGWVVIS